MADKQISQLIAAETVNDEDLLVLQQGQIAKKLTGKKLGDYLYAAAAEKIAEVNEAVAETQEAVDELEEQKNTIAQSIAAMAELGTDTTLTTPGMAADAKTTGDRIGEVEVEALASLNQKTVSNAAIASFDDGADNVPVKELIIDIEPVQSGTGDPSPTNVRPISGRTGANINVSGADTSNPTTYPISWGTEAGTVYGGTLDVVNGELTSTKGKIVLNGNETWVAVNGAFYTQALPEGYALDSQDDWICNKYKPATKVPKSIQIADRDNLTVFNQNNYESRIFIKDTSITTVADLQAALASTPVEIVLTLPTSSGYTVIPASVSTLKGENNIWADAGNINSLIYYSMPIDDNYVIEKMRQLEEMISGVEPTGVASTNYASGSLIISEDVLVRLTANIVSGETISTGTGGNATETTIEAELQAIKNSITSQSEKIDEVKAELEGEIYGEPINETFTLVKGRYNATKQVVGQTPVLDSSAGKRYIIDVSEAKNGGSYKISIASVTANQQICTLLTNQNDIIISKPTTYRANGDTTSFLKFNSETNKYEATLIITGNVRKVYFSIYGGSDTIDVEIKRTPIIKEKVYVSANGDDTNTGLSSSLPFATLAKAVESGARTISILSDLYQNITINRDVTINGNGHTIYGDVVLTTEAYNSILRASYSADTRITNCFVDNTTPLTETVSGSDWKGDKYNIACYADDQKLLPVADVTACEETENSFTWDNGYFYINASGTRFSYVTTSTILNITDGNVKINDLKVKHAYSNLLSGDSCSIEINGCELIGSVNQNCITVENSQLTARNVEAAYSWNDGINTHGRGDSTIIDCYCHDCSDDGISQHDSTTGVIIGGEFCNCGKGGISSPINSAKVDIYNAYIHDNTGSASYGIYASNSSGTTQTFRAFGCVIKNNRIGLKIVGHQLLAYGCKLAGNTTDESTESGGTITYLD